MPTRTQPSMDLQLNVSGMGPAMMKLDLGVMAADIDHAEFIEEFLPLIEAPLLPVVTRWERIWAVLNMDVKDIWRDLVSWWRQRG